MEEKYCNQSNVKKDFPCYSLKIGTQKYRKDCKTCKCNSQKEEKKMWEKWIKYRISNNI